MVDMAGEQCTDLGGGSADEIRSTFHVVYESITSAIRCRVLTRFAAPGEAPSGDGPRIFRSRKEIERHRHRFDTRARWSFRQHEVASCRGRTRSIRSHRRPETSRPSSPLASRLHEAHRGTPALHPNEPLSRAAPCPASAEVPVIVGSAILPSFSTTTTPLRGRVFPSYLIVRAGDLC